MTKLLICLLFTPYLLISLELTDKIELSDGLHFSDVNRKDSTILVQDTLGNISIYDMNTFELLSSFPAKEYESVFHFEELGKVYGYVRTEYLGESYIDVLDYNTGEKLDSFNIYSFLYKRIRNNIGMYNNLGYVFITKEKDNLYFGYNHVNHNDITNNSDAYFEYMRLNLDLDTLNGHFEENYKSLNYGFPCDFQLINFNNFAGICENYLTLYDSNLKKVNSFTFIKKMYSIGDGTNEIVLNSSDGDKIYNLNTESIENFIVKNTVEYIPESKLFIKLENNTDGTYKIKILTGIRNEIEQIDVEDNVLEIKYNSTDKSLITISKKSIQKYSIEFFKEELNAAYYSNDITYKLGDTIYFNNLSFGDNLTYKWDFDNGDISSAIEPNYTFDEVGTFEVKLTISNGEKEDTFSQQYRIINDDPIIPKFSYNKTIGKIPFDVKFTDESEGEVYYWEWDFGDGQISNEQNPMHTFTKLKNHTIKLKISNGLTDSILTYKYLIEGYSPELTAINYDYEYQRRIINFNEKYDKNIFSDSDYLHYSYKEYNTDFCYFNEILHIISDVRIEYVDLNEYDFYYSNFFQNINRIDIKSNTNQLEKLVESNSLKNGNRIKILNNKYYYNSRTAVQYDDVNKSKSISYPLQVFNQDDFTYIVSSPEEESYTVSLYNSDLDLIDKINYNSSDQPFVFVDDKLHIISKENSNILKYETYSKDLVKLDSITGISFDKKIERIIIFNKEIYLISENTIYKLDNEGIKEYSAPDLNIRNMISIDGKNLLLYGALNNNMAFVKLDENLNYLDELVLNDRRGSILRVEKTLNNKLAIGGILYNDGRSADEYFILTRDKWFELPNTVEEYVNNYEEIVAVPNPFDESTKLEFESQKVGAAELVISDLNGRNIEKRTVDIKKGMNSININSQEMGLSNGVYFVEIKGSGLNLGSRIILK